MLIGRKEGKGIRQEGREEEQCIRTQLFRVNMKRMMGLKTAAMAIIIESRKHQQWMLKLIGESLLRNTIFT